jgi:hypothetical protein
MKHHILVIVSMLGALCAPAAPAAPAGSTPSDTKARLEKIYDAAWQRWLREDPTMATSVGDPRYNDRWPDLSLAAIQKSHEMDSAAQAQLAAIGTAGLSPASESRSSAAPQLGPSGLMFTRSAIWGVCRARAASRPPTRLPTSRLSLP